MFVTGLEFLPVALSDHTVTSIAEAAVVSISVDNQVCIHSLSYRSEFCGKVFCKRKLIFCFFRDDSSVVSYCYYCNYVVFDVCVLLLFGTLKRKVHFCTHQVVYLYVL